MRALSPEQLKGLDAHVYSCTGRSIIEPIFQVFWNWLVKQLPLWLAPNLVTFLGLIVNAVTSLLVCVYAPHMTETAPWWTYVLFSFGLFVYQSLDAVDGKQARRTYSATPLGELFDHGCDAVAAILLLMVLGCALELGDVPTLYYAMFICGQANFFATHWRAFCQGKVIFGKLDVTEVQLLIIALCLVSGLAGPQVLKQSFYGFEYRLLIVGGSLVIAVLTIAVNVFYSFMHGWTKPGGIIPGALFATLIFLYVYIFQSSPSKIAHTQPVLLTLLIGLTSAKLSISTVVAHMSKMPMSAVQPIFVAPALVVANIALGAPVDELFCVVIATVYAFCNLAIVATLICKEIAEHMNIFVFSLQKRAK